MKQTMYEIQEQAINSNLNTEDDFDKRIKCYNKISQINMELGDYPTMIEYETLANDYVIAFKQKFGFDYLQLEEHKKIKNLNKLLRESEIELQRLNIGSYFHRGCVIHSTNNLRNGLSSCIQVGENYEMFGLSIDEMTYFVKKCLTKTRVEKSKIVKQIYKTQYRYRE
jgi:hypothetical protein